MHDALNALIAALELGGFFVACLAIPWVTTGVVTVARRVLHSLKKEKCNARVK